MICPFCHQTVEDGKKFCTGCGKRIPACPTCGKPVTKPTKFCIGCGTALPEEVLAPFASAAVAGNGGNAAGASAPVRRSSGSTPPEPPRTRPDRHFCTRCGSPCPSGQKLCDSCLAKQAQPARPKSFCVRCGTPVAEGEKLCPECRVTAARERRTAKEKSSSNKSLFVPILIGIVAVLLLVIGCIAFIAISNSGSKDTDAESDEVQVEEEEQSGEENDGSIKKTETSEAVSDEAAEEADVAEEPVEEPEEEAAEEPETTEEAAPAEEESSNDPAEEMAVTAADSDDEADPDSVEAMGKLDYFIQHCNDQYFDADYFKGFTKDEARLARNGIYARSGRDFNDDTLVDYYSEHFDWYTPRIDPDDWKDSYFNTYQAENLKVVKAYEDSLK